SLKLWPFQLGVWLGRPKHVPYPPDETLDEGDAFGPLQVLHAAGHSPGHLAFWWPERRFLIAGDAVATWPELCAGWTAFNLNLQQVHRDEARRRGADEVGSAAEPGAEREQHDRPDDREHQQRPSRNASPRVAREPLRQRSLLRERRRELRRAAHVDVHRPHGQRDREHSRRVPPRTPEADGDEVGERDLQGAASGEGDGRDRKADVED